jgi:release factor glutamine methyltransferase
VEVIRIDPSEIPEQLRAATAALSATSDTPRLDAELLLAHALDVERTALMLDPGRFAVPAGYADLIARRLSYEPVAYIIGYQDFWTIRLSVGPGVLIPRSESETLIEAAVAHFGAGGPATILDLGTGPGTLLLAALAQWPAATGVGVDISSDAIRQARANVRALGMRSRARIVDGDWMGINAPFDLILCNPPYIADTEALMPDVANFEPHEALFAGDDGLDDYRMIIPVLEPQLTANGIAILEIGATQAACVSRLAEDEGFAVVVRQDLAGRDRALILSRA